MGETVKRRQWINLFVIIISCSFLISCEHTLTIKGTVYDNDTKAPLKGVVIKFVVDSQVIEKAHPENDTVSKEQRMEMRKKGIKDDYSDQIFGFGRYVIPYTNDSGKFLVGNMLFRHFGTWALIFSKEGYKTDTFKDAQVSDGYSGNFKVYLKRK